MDKELYVITKGAYEGRVGFINKNLPGYKYGNVMFYPIEGKNPYCVCKNVSDIRKAERR